MAYEISCIKSEQQINNFFYYLSCSYNMDQIFVSYQNFDRIFEQFKIQYKEDFHEHFIGFDTGTIRDWEEYKPDIAYTARELLGIQKWTIQDIGSGKLLASILSALKARTPSGTANNLVHWTTPRNLDLLIQKKNNLHDFEETAYKFYNRLITPEDAFNRFTAIIGRKYPLIAYLFFIHDPTRYLPIAPSHFDPVFTLLGIDFQTSGGASWKNYSDYISIIRTIQQYIKDEGYPETRLIDAHSFCWMLSTFSKEGRKEKSFSENAIQKRETIPFNVWDNIAPNITSTIPGGSSASNGSPPDDDQFLEKHKKNIFFGNIAEERVFEEEKKRLIKAGKSNLASDVEWTSRKNMSAGYDIRSFEVDGKTKYIEVKAASGNLNQLSFILSDPEFQKSRELPNYFIYCVLFKKSEIDRIIAIPSEKVDTSYLKPLNYRVAIKRTSN